MWDFLYDLELSDLLSGVPGIAIGIVVSYLALLAGLCLSANVLGEATVRGLYLLIPGLRRFMCEREMRSLTARRYRYLIGSMEHDGITHWWEFDYVQQTKTTYTTRPEDPALRRDVVVKPMASSEKENHQ